MPVSKNRKGHAKKAIARKIRNKERKAHLENMYRDMMEQLKDKNLTMTEMLNKEDVAGPPTTDQTSLGHNNEVVINRPYTVIDMPECDPNEPIYLSSQSVVLSDEEQAEQDRIQESAIITTHP